MAETDTNKPEIKPPEAKPAETIEKKSGPATPAKGGYWWGTGRRKSSIARVRIRPGDGKVFVNKKQLADYFKKEQDRTSVIAPLVAVKAEKSFDIFINVRGGGTTGQAGASLLGIARALKSYDETFVQILRDSGHLTRDPRMVERKKP
jgi:small subunit ribosomal protein S9